MTSVPDWKQNLDFVSTELSRCEGLSVNDLVVLPECFSYFGGGERGNLALANSDASEELFEKLSQLAAQHKIYLVAGSVPTKSTEPERYRNTCKVFDANGVQVASYDKIHLFDVDVADSTKSYRESDMTQGGDNIVMFDWCGVKVGVAICYDLRFPGLFQTLRENGAELIVLPSAFTKKTGSAHWHTLIKARAIENQCFFAAADQVGEHQNGRETYGHSVIVDPWGNVLSDAKTELGLFGSELNFQFLEQIRRDMPVARHNRFATAFQPTE